MKTRIIKIVAFVLLFCTFVVKADGADEFVNVHGYVGGVYKATFLNQTGVLDQILNGFGLEGGAYWGHRDLPESIVAKTTIGGYYSSANLSNNGRLELATIIPKLMVQYDIKLSNKVSICPMVTMNYKFNVYAHKKNRLTGENYNLLGKNHGDDPKWRWFQISVTPGVDLNIGHVIVGCEYDYDIIRISRHITSQGISAHIGYKF